MPPVRHASLCRRLGCRCLLVFQLCAPTLALAIPVTELQTLFYTPAQRQEMSRARLGLTGTQEAASTRLDGVVLRAAGKGTVWLNQQAHREGQAPAGPLRGVDALVDGQRLRVGERVDKTSGERTDVLAPGAVQVHKP